ncbi:MAG: DUF3604 domain-containing protein [Myxococcota bacterium]
MVPHGISRRAPVGFVPIALAVGVWLGACKGGDQPVGRIEGERRPAAVQEARSRAQQLAGEQLAARAGAPRPLPARQILFGDLHVHTTYSIDAFLFSLPVFQGEGSHPPADACDFARYCAELDFYALTDHAESITAEHWALEKESIRQCNARAGDPRDPDLVAYLGFEWTQVGPTPESHYGHKNVIFPGTQDDQLPARPISSLPDEGLGLFAGLDATRALRWLDPLHWPDYSRFIWLIERLMETPRCPRDVDTRDLPLDCHENAPVPQVLYRKLAEWGLDVLVIPHGNTWGLYTPPGASWEPKLRKPVHDPERQRLIEIMSGHGNSEEYRSWRELEIDEEGQAVCPEPTPDYLPCCWQAGEIMRQRCEGLSDVECEARVKEARRLALEAGALSHLVFPDTTAEDWLDCGQCRDCFKPSLSYRPRGSVQYAMALSNFEQTDAAGRPLRYRYGFLASSDNHGARPGTGYKQFDRRRMTEAAGPRSAFYARAIRRRRGAAESDPQRPQRIEVAQGGFVGADLERVTSFLYPGGLVAVHANGRSREAIWDALMRREVYGTSGPRILLSFDLLNGPEGPVPMGAEVALEETPRFEVRAVGAFVQKPGCPEESLAGLSPERLERLCRGECYNPGDERHPIVALEVVRIRPQAVPGEDVEPLIEDPWRRFECEPDPAGCTVRFEDPDYVEGGRDTLYYVRALQEATPAINGANLRTEIGPDGRALRTQPCYGDYRTPFDEDCLAPVQERAWSSPIFVDRPR